MAGPASLAPTPSDIGGVAQPLFAVLPDPERLFLSRAERFETLAPGHPLEAYLGFLAELSRAQHAVVAEQPPAQAPDADFLTRAEDFAMPPLDRARMRMDETIHAAFERLLERAGAIAMPEPAAEAVRRLRDGGRETRETALNDALDSAAGAEALAEHVFAAAALQTHFVRLAAALDAERL
ncbi:formate dehydrogenase accessory protein FdhE, partial [Methylopila musalis]